MRLRAGLGVAVVLFCGLTHADEPPAAGYEHLRVLEPLIGTWTTELVAPKDIPTAEIKEGAKGRFCLTYEWCNNRNGIVVREQSSWEGATEAVEYGVTLIGWDHAAKKIVAKRLGSTTGWSQPVYSKTDDGWAVNITKVRPDGVKVGADHTLKLSGDTIIAQAINRFEGDEKLDDGIVREFTRK